MRHLNDIALPWGLSAMGPLYVFVVLTAGAYLSLRVSLLGTIEPSIPTRLGLLRSSVVSATLVLFAASAVKSSDEAVVAWGCWAMPTAFGMICGPAIVPPQDLTAEDEPNPLMRWVKNAVNAKIDALIQGGLVWLVSTAILSWLPLPKELPPWLAGFACAAAFSILTRPIAIRIPDQAPGEPSVVQAHAFTPDLFSLRLWAIGAIGAWLLYVGPVLDTVRKLGELDWYHLAGVLVGMMLVGLLSKGVLQAESGGS